MRIFYLTLILSYSLALMARISRNKFAFKKPNLFITIGIIILLVVVSGLRNGIGDTGDYKHLYELIATGQKIDKDAYESGFIAILTAMTKISPDSQFMVFGFALVTNVLNILVLRKYFSLFELQVYMYITAGYYLTTMNGIRQALAAAIVFAATRFIVKGKFIPYAIICLLVSTIHSSAIIMIPVYFIAREKPWSKKIGIMIGICIVVLIFIEPIMGGIFDAAEGSKLGGYEESVTSGQEGGTNILRVVVEFVPVAFAYLGRNKLKDSKPEINIFINMSLINLIFMLFALYTWLFARFNLYFQLYTFILLPYLIQELFDKKERRFIYYCFMVCYFIFFYYENVIALGMNYTSNYINF